MKNHRLNESTIGSAKVSVDIVPKGKCIPDVRINPTSITVHQTGNPDSTARANHNYMKNINKSGARIASWHFTVDDKEIIQAQSTNYKTYHAGCTAGNNSSIGIEICMFSDKAKQKKAYDNAIALIKILMKYYCFDISKVKRHYDWTKKHCPAWLIEGKYGYTWSWFKNEIKKAPAAPGNDSFLVKIIYTGKEGLNVRKEPTTASQITGVVYYKQVFTIVETKNNWGKLKSGLGWISLNEKYVQKL